MATPSIVPRANGEGGLGTAAKGWGELFVTNTTTSSASQGGKLVLAANDGAVMADDHRLGVIEFKGAEDTSNTLTNGARIQAICDATWSATENGASLEFYTTASDAQESLTMTLDSAKNLTCYNKLIIGGADEDGADRALVFAHSTLKSVVGIDDDQDRFVINTDGTFEATNDLEIDASGNVTIGNGTLNVGTAKVTGIEHFTIACSDDSTLLTTGTAKATFRMPYAFTLTAVRANVTTAPTGSVLTVDINESGSTILSTKLTIDANEKTSTSAATAAVMSDTSLADDAEITIDIDGVGSTVAGKGLKVTLIGYQS